MSFQFDPFTSQSIDVWCWYGCVTVNIVIEICPTNIVQEYVNDVWTLIMCEWEGPKVKLFTFYRDSLCNNRHMEINDYIFHDFLTVKELQAAFKLNLLFNHFENARCHLES